jgi:ankyrin repeat protein
MKELYDAVVASDLKKITELLAMPTPAAEERIKIALDQVYGHEGQQTTLACIAATLGNEQVLQSLVRANADINKRDSQGYSPLYHAVMGGHTAVVKFLLKSHIDKKEINRVICDTNNYQKTLLYIAAEKGYHKILPLLISAGAVVTFSALLQCGVKQTALEVATINNHSEAVKVLLEKTALSDITSGLVAIAVQYKDCEILKMILDKGFLLKQTDPAVHRAMAANNKEGVELLLRHGANPVAYMTRNALHSAIDVNFKEGVLSLIGFLAPDASLEVYRETLYKLLTELYQGKTAEQFAHLRSVGSEFINLIQGAMYLYNVLSIMPKHVKNGDKIVDYPYDEFKEKLAGAIIDLNKLIMKSPEVLISFVERVFSDNNKLLRQDQKEIFSKLLLSLPEKETPSLQRVYYIIGQLLSNSHGAVALIFLSRAGNFSDADVLRAHCYYELMGLKGWIGEEPSVAKLQANHPDKFIEAQFKNRILYLAFMDSKWYLNENAIKEYYIDHFSQMDEFKNQTTLIYFSLAEYIFENHHEDKQALVKALRYLTIIEASLKPVTKISMVGNRPDLRHEDLPDVKLIKPRVLQLRQDIEECLKPNVIRFIKNHKLLLGTLGMMLLSIVAAAVIASPLFGIVLLGSLSSIKLFGVLSGIAIVSIGLLASVIKLLDYCICNKATVAASIKNKALLEPTEVLPVAQPDEVPENHAYSFKLFACLLPCLSDRHKRVDYTLAPIDSPNFVPHV